MGLLTSCGNWRGTVVKLIQLIPTVAASIHIRLRQPSTLKKDILPVVMLTLIMYSAIREKETMILVMAMVDLMRSWKNSENSVERRIGLYLSRITTFSATLDTRASLKAVYLLLKTHNFTAVSRQRSTINAALSLLLVTCRMNTIIPWITQWKDQYRAMPI